MLGRDGLSLSLSVLALLATRGCRPSRAPDEDAFALACAAARADLGDWVLDDEFVVPTSLEDPSGHALDSFREALERAARGQGAARIVVYGGSHTASDLYTGTLRHALQAGFGDLGHGFVMPVPPFEDYWQSGIRIEPSEGFAPVEPGPKRAAPDAYGIAGMAFDAEGPALAEIETAGTRASRLEVLFLAQPGGGSLRVSVDGTTISFETNADRVQAASIVVATSDGPHRVAIEALGDGPVRLYGVALEREGSGVVLDQLGLAGAKARHHRLWDEEVWYALLASRRPDLFVVSYGNNEADDEHIAVEDHVAAFDGMLARFRQRFPRAACLVVGPTDRAVRDGEGWRNATLVTSLSEAQRELAATHGCAFFDTLHWQGGAGAMVRWQLARPPLARDDGVHLTEFGYRRLGAALGVALLDEVQRLDATRLAPQPLE